MAPQPKKRHAKSRTRTRKSAIKLVMPKLAKCPKCDNLKFPHRACPKCGYYSEKSIKSPVSTSQPKSA
ncbi:50S ribosomal protein L32 [Candidatus Curtissbacteria bacterium]|nr:50S ribosomal protein L32 [Candidatus Curtissbacteria bacterium]